MKLGPLLARKRVQDARDLVAATREKFDQESSEIRAAYERFYNNLALFSGGTVALSLTYLGYLKASPKPVLFQNLLVGSWSFLLVCLALSLFYSFLYSYYLHFGRLRELHTKRQMQCQTELQEFPQLNMPEITSQAERDAHREALRKAALAWEDGAKWAGRRESLYYFFWMWGGLAARLAFLVGISLLFSFAVANI